MKVYKRWFVLAIVCFCGLLIIACSGPNQQGEQASQPNAQEQNAETNGKEKSSGNDDSAKEPKHGGTLIHALDSDPPLILPPATSGVTDQTVGCKIYEGLVHFDEEYKPAPALAKSWDISPDAKTYTFHLQDGVNWHDGQPFTSADVKFTFEQIVAKYSPRASDLTKYISSIETPDDYTVVFNLSEPYGPLMSLLACGNTGIAAKHIFEGTEILDNPAATTNPIGTGPFKMIEWVRGQHIVLERNEDYWQKPKPYLDRIIMRIIPDPTARVIALEAGEVDYISDYMFPADDYKRLAENPDITVQTGVNLPGDDVLIFNTRNKPMDDPRLRRAIFTAINRQQIVDQAYNGLGQPAKSSISAELTWAYNPKVDYTKLYPYDPEKAKQMLDEAGYQPGPDGVRLRLRLVYDTAKAGFQPFANIIRDNLKDVGIEVTLVGLERQVMLDQVFKRHDFDITIQGYTTSGDPTAGVQRLYVTSSIGTNPFNNASAYSNPVVDELFEKGATAPTIEERAKYFHQVQEILAEDVPSLTLIQRGSADIARANVKGLWTSNRYYLDYYWENVWIDE